MNSSNPFPGGGFPGPNNDITVNHILGNAYLVVRYVAERMSIIQDVHDNLEATLVVFESLPQINDVSANMAQVQGLYDNLTALLDIHSQLSTIVAVSDNLDGINSINDNLPAIQELLSNLEAINTAVSNISDIIAVSENIDNIAAIGENLDFLHEIVDNLPIMATLTEAEQGLVEAVRSWSPALIKAAIESLAPAALVRTVLNKSPDSGGNISFTKSDLDLGNVANFPVASSVAAIAGESNELYMTPLRTAGARASWFNTVTTPLSRSILGRTTASQVRADIQLNLVPNFSAATNEIAIAGESEEHLMTPKNTKDLVESLTGGGFEIFSETPETLSSPIIYVIGFGIMEWSEAHTIYRNINCGDVFYHSGTSAKIGSVKANGGVLSKADNAALWTKAQDNGLIVENGFWTAGSLVYEDIDEEAFRIPDLRGEFIRAWDDGRGVDSGRVFGSDQADAFASHNHTGTAASNGAHTHTFGPFTGSGSGNKAIQGESAGTVTRDTSSEGAHTHTLTINATGDTETRPRNVALLACIYL